MRDERDARTRRVKEILLIPSCLFTDVVVSSILDKTMYDTGSASDAQPVSAGKLKLLQVDALLFGLLEEQITTIVGWSQPTRLPFAPASVSGVVCIQGRMFTVLDVGSLLRPTNEVGEADEPGQHASPRFIVALRGDEQLALAVDALPEMIEVSLKEIRAAEELSLSLFPGTMEHEGLEVPVLDLKELFPAVIQGRERRRRRI